MIFLAISLLRAFIYFESSEDFCIEDVMKS